MLQQTRVEAVIPYYLKWMQSFPTVVDLAKATEEEVNSHWAGLGFYRRARLLHAGAKRVVEEFNGELPSTVKDLLRIEVRLSGPGRGNRDMSPRSCLSNDVPPRIRASASILPPPLRRLPSMSMFQSWTAMFAEFSVVSRASLTT